MDKSADEFLDELVEKRKMGEQQDTTNFSDHDLLIRIDERLKKVDMCLNNHLRHHWAITVVLLLTVLGLVAKILIN